MNIYPSEEHPAPVVAIKMFKKVVLLLESESKNEVFFLKKKFHLK